MTRRTAYDVEAMDTHALVALVAQCERRIHALRAPYAKARREWAALKKRAEAELARRRDRVV